MHENLTTVIQSTIASDKASIIENADLDTINHVLHVVLKKSDNGSEIAASLIRRLAEKHLIIACEKPLTQLMHLTPLSPSVAIGKNGSACLLGHHLQLRLPTTGHTGIKFQEALTKGH